MTTLRDDRGYGGGRDREYRVRECFEVVASLATFADRFRVGYDSAGAHRL